MTRFASCLRLILAIVLVSGCASSDYDGWMSSYVAKEYPVGAETVVVEEMVEALVGIYPPGHTAIHLRLTKSQEDSLGQAFENALRTRGFTLVPEQTEGILTVSYVLDRLNETTWYSRLSLSNGTVLTRTWRLVGGNLMAEAATKTANPKQTTEIAPPATIAKQAEPLVSKVTTGADNAGQVGGISHGTR